MLSQAQDLNRVQKSQRHLVARAFGWEDIVNERRDAQIIQTTAQPGNKGSNNPRDQVPLIAQGLLVFLLSHCCYHLAGRRI